MQDATGTVGSCQRFIITVDLKDPNPDKIVKQRFDAITFGTVDRGKGSDLW